MWGYYSTAVIKYYDQKQVMEEGVCLGLWFQEGKNPSWPGSRAAEVGRMSAGAGG